MIALTLLLLLGLYIGIFVLAGMKTKNWTSRILLWAILISPIVALTWDMPVGYYRYKALCAAEGGLRVYELNPPQATVLRMDARRFEANAARSVLSNYPTLIAVEARDKRFDTAVPPAYARYERNPESPIPTKGPRDAFTPIVTSLDQVERRLTGTVTLQSGPSQAEYTLTKEDEERPIRLSITRQWLRKADGTLVASVASIVFRWTNEQNTLLGRTSVEECPARAPHTYKDDLITIVARPLVK